MSSNSLDCTIAEPRSHYLLTQGGVRLRLRAVTLDDGRLLEDFFAALSPEDMRFRFLDTRRQPNSSDIAAMIQIDHRRGEHVLAFDAASGQLTASMMVLADARMEAAEVAIAVAGSWRGRGIGWTLLQYASDLAFIRGLKKLQSVESRDNHDALAIERALGFRAKELDGDPGLVLVEADLG